MKQDYILATGEEKNEDKDNENESRIKDKENYLNSDNKEIDIKVLNNHIYFYTGVSKKSALELNIKLREVQQKILNKYNDHTFHQEYIYLHINSFGGSVFAAFSIIDTIKNLKIPVISIIEGAAASAATLISVVCEYRIIYKTSYMLIHQLSSGTWGKMDELEDEMDNLKELMNCIKNIYKTHTKIPDSEIKEILKHDIWWKSNICYQKGLVDEIRETKHE